MPTWQRVPRPGFGKETLAEQGCDNGSSKGRRRVVGKPEDNENGEHGYPKRSCCEGQQARASPLADDSGHTHDWEDGRRGCH